MKDIAVSVLIANYNNAKFIEECINSLRNQTYKDIETGEIFHTKEDILKSMFEDEDEE